MPARALHELQRRAVDLRASVAAARRELRRGVAAERVSARAWQLGPSLTNEAVLTYALAGCSAEPAVRFLVATGRQRHWPERAEDDLRTLVEDLYLQIDLEDLVSLMDTESPLDAAAMRAAQRRVLEWRLFTWTQGLNYDKGVAPCTAALLDRLEECRSSLPGVARPISRGGVTESRARRWATRWRRFWGGRHGRLRLREPITAATMRSKAVVNRDVDIDTEPSPRWRWRRAHFEAYHAGPFYGPPGGLDLRPTRWA
jgi:hypothetical protein